MLRFDDLPAFNQFLNRALGHIIAPAKQLQHVPDLRGAHRGDQLVRVSVETPRKLTGRQRELLEEFARNGGEDVSPLSKGFFDKVKEMFG